MVTAVEMTITLGRTLYGAPQGNTDSDDTTEGSETRVSVTWRLTESEQNLPLTASLLAEKTVQVLETADRTIRCKEEQPAALQPVSAQSQPPPLPASVPLANGAISVPPLNGAASPGSTAAANETIMNGTAVNGTSGNGMASRSYATAYVPRITKAQSLAIQSLCTRHGVADWELRRLVWEQFGKKSRAS